VELINVAKLSGVKFKTVGVTFENPNGTSRQQIISNMTKDSPVSLKREPSNLYDRNAVAVLYVDQQIGYIPREFAQVLAPMMDQGRKFTAIVDQVDIYQGTYYCHIIVDEV
jgi:hypothetical protein